MDEIPPIWLRGGRIGKRWLDQCVLGRLLYRQDKNNPAQTFSFQNYWISYASQTV